MANRKTVSIVVGSASADAARGALGELVMAWARDIATGEPRYILELDDNHRGSKCGCECPSCGLPLTAVNAARTEFIKRPHFRHPEGAGRGECSVLAARAAALRLLVEDGVLELPRRRMSGTVAGLSGVFHTAWIELPPQKFRVAEIDFRDRAAASLTLEDGRILRVLLTGTSLPEEARDQDKTSDAIPTIFLDIKDGSVAGLEPAEIRKRLQLLPDAVCWRSHWDDADLRKRATETACVEAYHMLDWLPDDGSIPEGLSPALKRETLLHLEVKRVVEKAGEIMVPGLSVFEELQIDGRPTLQRRWAVEEHMLRLTNPRLEHRMGRTIPDLVCEAWTARDNLLDPFLVEVTVTNPIDDERLERIRSAGHYVLEIDLSLTGGLISRDELYRLVVHEIACKRWLNYPELDAVRQELQEQLLREMEGLIHAEDVVREKQRTMQALAEKTAVSYLSAVERMLLEQVNDAGAREVGFVPTAADEVADLVKQMTSLGYPEAGEEALLRHHGILARILSIQKDRGIGYTFASAMGVLNASRQSQLQNRHDWTLYLIAARVYEPSLNDDQKRWLDAWRQEVRDAIEREDFRYMRHAKYDRILSLLFPEMAPALAKPKGKRPPHSEAKQSSRRRKFEQPSAPLDEAGANALMSAPSPIDGLLAESQDPRDGFLRGARLEAWERSNPEMAAVWASKLKNLGLK